MNEYVESTDSRVAITDTATVLTIGKGYEVWVESGSGGTTVTYSGDLNTQDITPTLSFTDAAHGYNLLGNPFTSALSWDSLYLKGSPSNIDDQVWVWNGSTWLDYVSGTHSGSLTDGIIPRGQGFYVHANAASPSITITKTSQVHSSQTFYKSSGRDMISHIVLEAIKENKTDQLWIVFKEGLSEEFENGFDGRKMISTLEGSAPQIYSKEGDEFFSIDALPPVDQNGRTIPVYFKANQNGEHSIIAKDLDMLGDVTAVLEDTRLNILQNLNKKPVYTFNAVTYQNPARFLLHLNRSANGIGENDAANIKTFTYNNYLYVQSMGDEVNSTKELAIYDMLGRKLVEKQVPPGDLIKIPLHLSDSYVIVKIISNGKVFTDKVFIQ
jgi:hypothetical protein